MLIVGLNKTTLLDYPGRVAATVFLGGCNFRCPFCHNAGIVLEPLSQGTYAEEEILSFLEKRKHILKGVCITGGEPTLQADLPEFLRRIKELGYQVKLDTNGYMPGVLKKLLDEQLLDYVAMDIKNCPEKYAMTVGMAWKEKEHRGDGDVSEFRISRLEESIDILRRSGIDYEFRTTVVKGLHTKEDLLKIADWIQGCPRYFLQQYEDNENVIYAVLHKMRTGENQANDFEGAGFHGYNKAEMKELAEAVGQVPGMAGAVFLRGTE